MIDASVLQRSNADKKRAALLALADPAYAGWTDAEIARVLGVSRFCVYSARREMEGKPEHKSRVKPTDSSSQIVSITTEPATVARLHPEDIQAIAEAVVARVALALKGA